MRIRVVKTSEPAFKSLMARVLQRRGSREGPVEKRVDEIIRACRRPVTACFVTRSSSIMSS
jgi:hypothetical protein